MTKITSGRVNLRREGGGGRVVADKAGASPPRSLIIIKKTKDKVKAYNKKLLASKIVEKNNKSPYINIK